MKLGLFGGLGAPELSVFIDGVWRQGLDRRDEGQGGVTISHDRQLWRKRCGGEGHYVKIRLERSNTLDPNLISGFRKLTRCETCILIWIIFDMISAARC